MLQAMGCFDFKRRLFATYYDAMTAEYDAAMAEPKRELLAQLHGLVVEIGPGTGSNLALLPEGVQWVGIEPNLHMHPLLKAKAQALGRSVDLRCLSAGKLPFEDGSVDCVLSTLVLCSVPDLDQTLAEILRVLKPGGRFVYWEHVLAPEGKRLRALQHLFNPLQRFLADGCRCNRDFLKGLERAGFQELRTDAFLLPKGLTPPWIRPHVSGVGIR